jgi:hypothetical protein
MWDFKSLKVELNQVGFDQIRRAHFGDSDHSDFFDVEEEERWVNCLGVECIKPNLYVKTIPESHIN